MQMRNKDDACLVLSQALILQLKHVTPSGSHSIFTGVPTKLFTYKAHGLLTFILRHHNHTIITRANLSSLFLQSFTYLSLIVQTIFTLFSYQPLSILWKQNHKILK
ncbi:hypothetical protein AHAS_Ahas16G0195400 [Arachis hypogaea]